MKKMFFLGPEGTYCEQTALNFKKILPEYELSPISTIAKIIELTDTSDNIGVLPIENSIEGIVRQTIDNIYNTNIKIQAETDLKIEHCLITKSNDIKKINHIISHPQALAQCQKYILENFDEKIDLIEASSTAYAGEILKEKDETYCAIVSPFLAEKLSYNILAENIGDVKENKTRFVLISKNNLDLDKKERTTFAFNTKNEPGALLKILSVINRHGLNLIYLESRPSKAVFGEYNFFCDIDKGSDEINDALIEIEKECNFYKLLGSYSKIIFK